MTENYTYPSLKATTVIAVKYKDQIAIGADGQATLGHTIAKKNVKKIRKLIDGKIVVGFAGATADAFSLLERFEAKLNKHSSMERSAIELTKEWRTDRYLRRLEAVMIAVNQQEILIISGSGDVLKPDNHIAAIGSGGNYAQAAAMALMSSYPTSEQGKQKEGEGPSKHAARIAKEIVQQSLSIAGELCIYTNQNIIIETPSPNSTGSIQDFV